MGKTGKWGLLVSAGVLVVVLLAPCQMVAADNDAVVSTGIPATLVLEKALMCESIEEAGPVNPAVAFPISIGTVYCLTAFNSVSQKTHVYHHWFRRDNVSTRIRLAVNPPRWSVYSSVRLREEDKGPWRVEIRDESNTLLQTLRFSITD
jgi:hypothetical protein